MFAPLFRNINSRKSRDVQIDFRGLNQNLYVGENEFSDMANMSSTHYPVLSPREKRRIYISDYDFVVGEGFYDLHTMNGRLIYVDGFHLHYGEYIGNLGGFSYAKRTLVPMGAKIIIFPDKKIFNTQQVEEKINTFKGGVQYEFTMLDNVQLTLYADGLSNLFGVGDEVKISDSDRAYINATYTVVGVRGDRLTLESENSPNTLEEGVTSVTIECLYSASVGELTFEDMENTYSGMATYTGEIPNTNGASPYISNTPPENPTDKTYWLDTTDNKDTLKQYSSASGMWMTVTHLWLTFSLDGGADGFSKGDAIEVTTSLSLDINGTYVIEDIVGSKIYVTTTKFYGASMYENVVITRKVPDMDFVCELNNRLWGCSSKNHEIYASKLGDPKNFYCYAGISTDSYAATVGSDGEFTGCASYLGSVYFFKENIIHRVYGSKPSNFQITEIRADGVEEGSEGSLSVVNGVLYYKSCNGVCAFDGNSPVEVSSALGTSQYSNANAGGFGDKYYISMCDTFQDYALYVYDTKKNLWHKEYIEHNGARDFTRIDNGLYFITGGYIAGIGETKEFPTFTSSEEDAVEWYAITGDILYAETHKKYVSRINIKASLEEDSELSVYVQYDHEKWKKAGTIEGASTKVYLLPIRTQRADNIRIKFEGKGNVKIFAVSKQLDVGSDV